MTETDSDIKQGGLSELDWKMRVDAPDVVVKVDVGLVTLGPGPSVIWPQYAALASIGGVLFSMARFRGTIGAMA